MDKSGGNEKQRQGGFMFSESSCRQKTYSDEELDAMSWDDKCRLIQAARHFDFCVSKFLKDVL